jgi:hypothetical protein
MMMSEISTCHRVFDEEILSFWDTVGGLLRQHRWSFPEPPALMTPWPLLINQVAEANSCAPADLIHRLSSRDLIAEMFSNRTHREAETSLDTGFIVRARIHQQGQAPGDATCWAR